MDSISLDLDTGKYFMDMTEEGKNEKKITEGFRKFFNKTVLNGK